MKKKMIVCAGLALFFAACAACNSKSSETEDTSQTEEGADLDTAETEIWVEPITADGWDIKEYDEMYIPGTAQEALDLALESYTGLSVKPIVVLATQVVAGTNYKFLATTAAVVPDAENTLSIVTVYADLDGNASITDVQDIDFSDIINNEAYTQEEESDEEEIAIVGGWHTGDEYDTVAADEGNSLAFYAVGEASAKGHELICTLATQVVAGTNYALLCRVTDDDGTCFYAIDFVCVPVNESEDPEFICEHHIDPANAE